MIALREVTVTPASGPGDAPPILDRVTLDVREGEWIALVGENGSGKSTLLHLLAGLIKASSGEITTRPSGRATPRPALLLQEPDNQFVTTSVADELRLALPPIVDRPPSQDERLEAAVSRFGLETLLGRNPHRLSGGEKQRLALATVWLQEPELLLLDEPTSYLDPVGEVLCAEFVRSANNAGATVVWATPGGDEVSWADRVVCLAGGKVVVEGSFDEVWKASQQAGIEFIAPDAFSLARELSGETEAADPTELASRLASRVPSGRFDTQCAELPVEPGGVVADMVAASAGYDGKSVVEGLDLTIREAECVGIAGANGAGKTTLLGLIAGTVAPLSGRVDRSYERVTEGSRQNVFYLFQSPERLFFAETVEDEIGFGLDNLGVPRADARLRAAGALSEVDLSPQRFFPRSPFTLSLGEMRRVALAIAIALEPGLLLLDEPTSCLDLSGRGVLRDVIARRRAAGRTTVIASHEVSFLAGVCDRIVWLENGGIAAKTVTAGGRLDPGSSWPGPELPILALQDELSRLGVEVVPRALTPEGLNDALHSR